METVNSLVPGLNILMINVQLFSYKNSQRFQLMVLLLKVMKRVVAFVCIFRCK